jgi:nicotinate phosphoribosyltransferase
VTHSSGRAGPPAASTALLTDRYELTMLTAALHSGAAGRRAVFEVFARALPHGRRYGVVAGTGRLLDALQHFTFGPTELAFLADGGIVDDTTLRYLESYRFGGDIWGYGEGDCYFPGSPILVVEAPFAEAVVLETLVLAILNHDTAIASAASRMVTAADGRPIIEMGSRRTHELAAVASARAAYIAGFSSTSNLRAGQVYGVPTSGTSAHAFSLVHDSEREAFAAQLAALGPGTTLLVDTFDVERAVRTAVELAGPGLGAVRIDSGDLPKVTGQVRALLDELGAAQTRIVLSGDLNEYSIAALAAAPVNGYGVGTSLVTGSGAPTAALVYKLVARAVDGGGAGRLHPVAKRSVGKPGRGGRKWAARLLDDRGTAHTELITTAPAADEATQEAMEPASGPGQRALLRPLVLGGEIVGQEPLAAARERHRRALDELPIHARQLSRGYPAIPTVFRPEDRDGTGR